MPEWLKDAIHIDADLALHVLVIRLAVALALGCVVAGIYRVTTGKASNQSHSLIPTLVLLTVLIAMVTLVIGNSVARAFSLVGALSIVRFRTVVEDTRDTAFVIFAVGVGMAIGAGFFTVTLVGIPFAAVAAFLFRTHDPRRLGFLDALLIIRLGAGHEPDALFGGPLAKHVQEHNLKALATARQGAAIELTYAIRLRDTGAAFALVAELNSIAGVQNVELRQA